MAQHFEKLLADAPLGTEGQHYSTAQLVETLNDLLCSTANMFFQNCARFKAHIATMLSVFQTDHRKHLSNLPMEKSQIAVFQALVEGNFTPLQAIFMDRSYLFSSLQSFLAELKPAAEIERKQCKKYSYSREKQLARYKAFFGMTASPLMLYTQAAAILELYTEFRNENINKYIRLSFNQAEAAQLHSEIHVDKKELFMNFIIAVNRAIDKCDMTKGTLTSYIQQWFLNAKTNAEFNHEYGIAYDMPAAQRAKTTKANRWHIQSNFSVSLDDDPNIQEETINKQVEPPASGDFVLNNRVFDRELLVKLRRVKDASLAFLALQLPIILTQKEKQKLMKAASRARTTP